MTQKLNPNPARTDLTDRECSKLIGGLIGSLALMTDVETVRRAVSYWAESDMAWRAIGAMRNLNDCGDLQEAVIQIAKEANKGKQR